MIKKDTILSTVDDRMTLLQWLKKIEEEIKESSGGSGLPEDYAKALQELIQFSGNKAEIGGDLEVDGVLSANSLPAGFGGDFVFAKLPIYLVDGVSDVDLGITLPVLLFHNNATAKYPDVEDASINSKYIMALTCGQMTVESSGMSDTIEFPTRFVPVYKNRNTLAESVEEALKGFITTASLTSNIPVQYDEDLRQLLKMTGDAVDDLYIDRMEVVNLNASLNAGNISGGVTVNNKLTLTESLAKKSSAKYQHTVTLCTPTSATDLFCFTAMSSKSTPIDSYQDLTDVFGGCTVAGYGLDETSKLAFTKLNLHGGTIATDSLTDGEESRTLASFQTVTFTDDVCVPK